MLKQKFIFALWKSFLNGISNIVCLRHSRSTFFFCLFNSRRKIGIEFLTIQTSKSKIFRPNFPCKNQIFNMSLSFTVEIISEDSISKWYREAHSPKGKMHFLEKMRPFMEWLQNAEEGKHKIQFKQIYLHLLEQTQ